MKRRHIVSAAIVLGAAVAAAATVAGDLVATPGAGVAELAANAPGSAPVSLANAGSSTIDVGTITPASCGNGVAFTVVGPALPRQLGPGSALDVQATCTGSNAFGIRRCPFDVRDSQGTFLTTFVGACETFGGSGTLAGSAQLDFGSVALGAGTNLTLSLTNTGALVQGTLFVQSDDVSGVFRIDAPNPCDGTSGCDAPVVLPPNQTVDLLVSCHPAAAITYASKLYAVTSSGSRIPVPVTLRCTGTPTTGPAISVSASALDEGSIEVLSGSATGNIRIQNVGTTALDVLSIDLADSGDGAAGDWKFAQSGACSTTPCTLQAGDETDLAVTFDPSQMFARDATMTITSTDPLRSTTTVQLSGIGLGRTFELAPGTPTSIDLGFVQNGSTAGVGLQLVDRGNKPIADGQLSVMPPGPFATAPANPISVPTTPAGTTVMLTCSPTGTGTSAVTTTLTGSAMDSLATPFTIAATCHGTDSPLIASPASIELGEIHTGTTVAARTIMLKNTAASGTLTLSGNPVLTTPNAELAVMPPASLMIPPGGSISFELTVQATGDIDLTDAIEVSDGSHTIEIPITGKVTTPAVFVPTSIALGTFCVGQPTTSSPVVLTATGTGTVGLPTAPGLAMAPSAFDLSLKAPLAYPTVLPSAAQAVIAVAPKRSSAAGSATDQVVWHTDVPTSPAPQTLVTAQFLDDGAAIAPAALAFGEVPIILLEPDAQPVTMQNCGASALAITPTIRHPFSIDTQSFPTTLMPAEITTFTVGFHPTQPGMFSDVLTIQLGSGGSNAPPPLQVALSGVGITGSSGPDAGSARPRAPSSFYDCSCSSGDPIGGWPIALAVMCVAVPRRRRARRSGILDRG